MLHIKVWKHNTQTLITNTHLSQHTRQLL